MFPVLPVTLWGWWRTGGQGDRPRRGIHGGHHPQPVGRGGAPGRTCPPCVPGGTGARGPDSVGAERGQCPLRTQQTGARGASSRGRVRKPRGHGPAWWTGGLHAASSGPSGCDWPAAGAAPPQRRARRRRGWRAGGAGPPPPPRPSRRGLSWGPGRRGPGWDRLSPCPTRPGSQPGSGPGTQDSASWGRSRQRGGSPLNIVTRQC